jgi:hypothetical protein
LPLRLKDQAPVTFTLCRELSSSASGRGKTEKVRCSVSGLLSGLDSVITPAFLASWMSSCGKGIDMDSPSWLGSSGSPAESPANPRLSTSTSMDCCASACAKKKAMKVMLSSNLWYIISTCPGFFASIAYSPESNASLCYYYMTISV